MATKKLKVEFVKRYEDRDKTGVKLVIPAGTKTEMTEAEVKKAGGKVRVIEQDEPVEEETGDEGSGD